MLLAHLRTDREVELKKQSSCPLHLVNKTDHYVAFKVAASLCICFGTLPKNQNGFLLSFWVFSLIACIVLSPNNVKTTSPKKYCVRPNTGVIMPRSSCDVTVTMQAQREAPPDFRCKDKFLIQSVISNHGVTAKDVIAEMFNKEEGKVVDECKMGVVYVSPSQPSSPVPEEPEEGSSPRASSLLDNGGFSSSIYDSVSKVSDESKEKHSEVSNNISMLTMERTSAIELNQKLRQELDLLQKEHSGGPEGFSLLFIILVGVLGILVGYLVKT